MKRLKLLYAEDEQITRQNHIKYINYKFDLDIIEASDGEEAYELYKEYNPDIILTDISMPKMCGLTLIEKIRRDNQEVRIIVLSAHNEEDKLLRAIELNLSSYQIKPINRDKLVNSLDKVISFISKSSKYYFSQNTQYCTKTNILLHDEKNIKLTSYEIKLINLFIKNKNQILKSETIHFYVWDDLSSYNQLNVRTLVKKVRKLLPRNSIETIYGAGYKLVNKSKMTNLVNTNKA